jgi:hypothetical protein
MLLPLQLFHVKHFLCNERFFSGITEEFPLQTPKYFMKTSNGVRNNLEPGLAQGKLRLPKERNND